MTTDQPRSPFAPMPLAVRASVGRAAAAVIGVMVLLAGVLSLGTGREDATVSAALLLPLVLLAATGCGVVVFAPWRRRLSPRGQEAVLTLVTALPAMVAVGLWLADDPADVDALLFLTALAVASALTLPARGHLAGVGGLALVVIGLAASRGAAREVAFVVFVMLANAGLGVLAAGVLGATVATGARREQEAEAASRALLAVVDAARAATSQDPQDVLDAVVAATARLQSDMSGLYLLRPDGRLEYGAQYRVPEHLRGEVFHPGEGLAGRVLREDRLVLVNDYQQFSDGMGAYRDTGLRAAMGTPIHVGDETVGVLVVGRYSPGGYDQAAITSVQLLADHAGRALELSRAIDEDRRLLQRLKSLHALQEDFVATVSHELRTPLTVIDGLAETLEVRGADLSPAQNEQLLSRLRANTTTLRTIVTSLLEAARLDRGLVEVEEEVVDLWDLLERCVARMSPILDNHTVEMDLTDALVLADGDLLERVVDNLLTNAQRHTPAGTTVRIQSRVVGTVATVTISDDGPGIAERDLAVITERFTRGGDLHTRPTRGLGLGLALADQVLRLHGTRLLVSSPPNTGAKFQFKLRVAD